MDDPLKPDIFSLVQQNRQQYWSWKSKNDFKKAQNQRIPNNSTELVVVHELVEMFESNPITCKNPLNAGGNGIILKRHNYPEHRRIGEDKQKDHTESNKKMKDFLLFKPLPK
ncbi:hypothetical protein D3C77_579360 [compost metagenome]